MSTLARVLEESGLATVTLSLIRAQAEAVVPPRCLHLNFPLGRPLGKPRDPAFQLGVLRAAFELLKRPSGPILEDFPETIALADDGALDSCVLPPRSDYNLPPEVDEVLALRPAYERQHAATGFTIVGRMVKADQLPDAVRALIAVADGTPWKEAPFPVPITEGHQVLGVVFDLRAFYEEAALAMVEHVPAARGPEDWFYKHTATGALVRRVQSKLQELGAPDGMTRGFVPRRQQGGV